MDGTVEAQFVYGKVNCHWGSPDGTVWAFEPVGFVLLAWDTTAASPRVAEPVEARPVLTSADAGEVREPLASTPEPLTTFSGWQVVNVVGDATRITLEDRTAAVESHDLPPNPTPEKPPK